MLLHPQSVYDTEVLPSVYDLPRVDIGSLMSGGVAEAGPVQIRYSSKKEFEVLAKKLKIMSDFRVSNLRICMLSSIYIYICE